MKRRPDAVVGGNRLRVMRKRCDQCLLSTARVVSKARADELLEECRMSDRYFICHKSPDRAPTVCRGFFDTGINTLCRIVGLVGAIEEVDPP